MRLTSAQSEQNSERIRLDRTASSGTEVKMFYIGYKSDYTTACKKQLRNAEYIGRAANGAEVYAVVPDAKWANHRAWYNTMNGNIPGLCKEQMRELLAATTEERAAKFFLDVNGELDRIREAIEAGTWTSNGDAYFCELCGEFELAAKVRTARAAYREKQEQERKERKAREEKEKQEREEAERQEREQQIEQAERDLRAGLFISPAYFEQLAEKYNVSLPIKFVGWLREWCGSICLKTDTEYGGYRTQYYLKDKRHKSTSIGTYGDKLGRAMAI